MNSLSRSFQRSAVPFRHKVYLYPLLASARKNKQTLPHHRFIYYFSSIFQVPVKGGQPSAGVCPPVAAAQLPPIASATLPRPPTLKAVKPDECRQAASPGLLVHDAGTAGREGPTAQARAAKRCRRRCRRPCIPTRRRCAFPPIREKRSSPLCTAVRRCAATQQSFFASQPQPPAQRRLGSGRSRTVRGCDLHFVPSQPPQGGAINARAAQVLRTTVRCCKSAT